MRGQFFGVTASSAATGRIIGPLLASSLLAIGGFPLAWQGASVVVALVVLWSMTAGGKLSGLAADLTEPSNAQSGSHP